MPAGNVPDANPTLVLPLSLSKAFTRQKELLALDNGYANGESQRSLLVTGFAGTWSMTKRLNATAMNTLMAFLDGLQAQTFWFYDPYETSPEFSYDPTGVATAGRYAVMLKNESYGPTLTLGRSETSIQLMQVS